MKTATKTICRDKRKHAAARCTADRQRPDAQQATWELHIGIIQLIIIGPESAQWFPVSKANYAGPVGTPEERMIAARAVAYLNDKHHDDKEVSKATITAILKQCAQGVTTL